MTRKEQHKRHTTSTVLITDEGREICILVRVERSHSQFYFIVLDDCMEQKINLCSCFLAGLHTEEVFLP